MFKRESKYKCTIFLHFERVVYELYKMICGNVTNLLFFFHMINPFRERTKKALVLPSKNVGNTRV